MAKDMPAAMVCIGHPCKPNKPRLSYTNAIMTQDTKLLGFIVGMSRSGTTWLSNSLNAHPSVTVFGETGFWGKMHIVPKGRTYCPADYQQILEGLKGLDTQSLADGRYDYYSLSQRLFAKLQDKNSSLSPRELFDSLCEEIAAVDGKDKVLEKTPHHLNWLDRILHAYPEAKILITYRNPYDFMLSYKHQSDRKPEPLRTELKKMYHPLGCAIVYRGYVNSILKASSRYGKQCLIVDFERIKSEPDDLLVEIQQFFGLRQLEKLAPTATNTSFPKAKKPELRADDYFWMNIIAGKQLEKLWFSRKRGSVRPILVACSLLKLPIWCYNVFRHFSKRSARPLAYLLRWLKS